MGRQMEIQADFLILGSGVAGLSLAIKAAELGTVAIVTKKEKFESNTNYAQGGIAVVQDIQDNFESHIQDTLICGAGLSHPEVVRFVVTEGPERVQELVNWGLNLPKSASGTNYDLGWEGGHSTRRVLHAKDLTGKEIERALIEQAGSSRNIAIYEHHIAIDLIMKSAVQGEKTVDGNRCLGAYVLDIDRNEVHTFRARFVILSTGGAGQAYLITTNPDICHRRRHRHGLSGRRAGRQHGIYAVPSHLPLSPRREVVSDQ